MALRTVYQGTCHPHRTTISRTSMNESKGIPQPHTAAADLLFMVSLKGDNKTRRWSTQRLVGGGGGRCGRSGTLLEEVEADSQLRERSSDDLQTHRVFTRQILATRATVNDFYQTVSPLGTVLGQMKWSSDILISSIADAFSSPYSSSARRSPHALCPRT